jgi:nitrate reductase NapE component
MHLFANIVLAVITTMILAVALVTGYCIIIEMLEK